MDTLKETSQWKKNLQSGYVPIDQVFNGSELDTCLAQNIYSCRDYINLFEYLFNENFGVKITESAAKRCPNVISIFSPEDRQRVFEAQFPKLDYDLVNLTFAIFSTPYVKYFEYACMFSDYNYTKNKEQLRECLNQILSNLEDREREILKKRIFEGAKQSELGKEFGVTSSRISAIENTAKRKLKYATWRLRAIDCPLFHDDHHYINYEQANLCIKLDDGNLDLTDRDIYYLPQNLHVPGSIFLNDHFTSLPQSLTVDGSIFCTVVPDNIPEHLRNKIRDFNQKKDFEKIIAFQVDADLPRQVAEIIEPMGLTMEELVQQFIEWFVSPETNNEALAWLKERME